MMEAFNAFVEKNNAKLANAAKRMAEALELERLYGRQFLQKSLSEAGCRWREITAPNAADFNAKQKGPARKSRAELVWRNDG